MGCAKDYKSAINLKINQELCNPSEITLPSSFDRRRRAGISIDTYNFLQLYNTIIAETSFETQVELAYKLILKRPADHDGSLMHQKILKNKGMIALITQLRYSKEGRSKNTLIKGLFVPYIKYRFQHWLSRASR